MLKLNFDIDSLEKFHKKSQETINKLKTQQRFKSEQYNGFTEEINKIASSSNDDKRMQSIDSIETLHMEQAKIL